MTPPNDYPEFARRAAEAPQLAADARLAIEWRTDEACRAARALMKVGERARRGRYTELLALEVQRACATAATFAAAAREADARLTAAEAQWAAERRWPTPQSAPRPRSAPASAPVVLPRRPPADPPRPLQPAATTTDLLTAYADHLEREGFVFAAAAERKRIADADHQARRRAVEEEVASTERIFRRLRDAYGEAAAERYMQEGA
jgi:hypothetical protein